MIQRIFNFSKTLKILFLSVFLVSCSIGTHLKTTEVRSFKGVVIPELSKEPILIEKISKNLIMNESRRAPLNLPLSLLTYLSSLIC